MQARHTAQIVNYQTFAYRLSMPSHSYILAPEEAVIVTYEMKGAYDRHGLKIPASNDSILLGDAVTFSILPG